MSHKKATIILTYHRLQSDAAPARSAADFYCISVSDFEQQLAVLSAGKFRTITLEEFLDPSQPTDPRNIVLTFDDGNESDVTLALPALQRFGFRAVFFICLEHIGQPRFLRWDQIRLLLASGMSVQSHGLLHRDLTQVPVQQVEDELSAARICLQRNLGTEVAFLALPGGFVNHTVCECALRAGYQGVCTSVPGLARPGQSLNRIAVSAVNSSEFSFIVARRDWSVRKALLQYRAASALKSLVGLSAYEELKARLWQ